jgi:hypothetical protein
VRITKDAGVLAIPRAGCIEKIVEGCDRANRSTVDLGVYTHHNTLAFMYCIRMIDLFF